MLFLFIFNGILLFRIWQIFSEQLVESVSISLLLCFYFQYLNISKQFII